MSSTDFRQIAIGNGDGKPERLFRAAVSAFCSLTRPTRQEVAQLEELALSLYPQVSPEARRFVAAALSETPHAPAGLVRRLAREDIEIAAPLLLRSTVLNDAALVSLIARRGLPHARVIARRAGLDPAISALIRALEASVRAREVAGTAEEPAPEAVGAAAPQHLATHGARAELARGRLRAMMADAGSGVPAASGDQVAELSAAHYAKLRATALSGVPAFFQTALADALDVAYADAGRLLLPENRDLLRRILAGLGLSAEQAFLLVAAEGASAFPTTADVRDFVEAYLATEREAGREDVRRLRAARLSALTTTSRNGQPGAAALTA